MGLLQPKRGGGNGQDMGRAICWRARGASPDQPRGLFLQQLGAKMSEPTKAQIKAMEWLAAEVGAGWKIGGGRLAAALSSAERYGYVESEWGDFGPRGGRVIRWRLTEKGLRHFDIR